MAQAFWRGTPGGAPGGHVPGARGRAQGQRAAGRGEDPARARHRRPRVPQERRSPGHEATQGQPPDHPDRPAQGGRHAPRDLQEDVRSLAPRGLRAARRTARRWRGAGVEGDREVDQVRGGRRGGC